MRLLGVLCLAAGLGWAQGAEPLRVVFLSPSQLQRKVDLWTDTVQTMERAARQLGIRLTVRKPPPWPGLRVAALQALLRGPERPDYLITTIHKGIGTRELEVAEAEGVPIFVINSGLLEEDRIRVGGPRQHFRHWIGEMLPDEAGAGRDLARVLFAEGLRRQPGPLTVLGLGGRETDWVARERNRGLEEAARSTPGVVLRQVVPCRFSAAQAREKAPLMLRRYPETRLLWSASDQMALAAAEALGPGHPLVLGGMDWEPEALVALQQGQLTASAGGHFLQGAFALVLLHDHHHGVDFGHETLSWSTRMELLTRSNVGAFLRACPGRDFRRLDFRSLSRVLNPGLPRHDFSIRRFLRLDP